jgi:DNA polymerase
MTLPSPKPNQPKSPNQLELDLATDDIPTINQVLRKTGCSLCELGGQYKIPVMYRGNPATKRMIVGEAPGLKEDQQGKPFVGPAGELLDKIFQAVGWDTNKDWYLTNVTKCRPTATPGSGKQNFTPTAVHRKACSIYLQREIGLIQPKLIVLLGKSAVQGMLPQHGNKPMKVLAGSIISVTSWQGFQQPVDFFVMYHPAYLLHSQRSPERYQELRKETWGHITLLREVCRELGLD